MNWKDELKKLQYPYKEVKLKVNGHEVSYFSSIFKMRVMISWHYHSDMKAEYLDKTSEIGKLFGKPKYDRMHPKMYKALKSLYGKKNADKQKKEYNERLIMYSPMWPSPAQIIKHLSKFEKIEVLTQNELF